MKSSQQDLNMQCKPAVSEVNMTQLQGGKTLRRSDSETFIGPECYFLDIYFLLVKKIRKNDHQPDPCQHIFTLFSESYFFYGCCVNNLQANLFAIKRMSSCTIHTLKGLPSCTEEMESALTNDIMVSSVLAGRSFWTTESTTAYDTSNKDTAGCF